VHTQDLLIRDFDVDCFAGAFLPGPTVNYENHFGIRKRSAKKNTNQRGYTIGLPNGAVILCNIAMYVYIYIIYVIYTYYWMFCVTQATDIPLNLEAVLDPFFESDLDIPKMYRRVGLSYLVFNPPWLVVWNIIFMTFHILGIIIPTDFNSIIFQRGRLKPPTSSYFVGPSSIFVGHESYHCLIMSLNSSCCTWSHFFSGHLAHKAWSRGSRVSMWHCAFPGQDRLRNLGIMCIMRSTS